MKIFYLTKYQYPFLIKLIIDIVNQFIKLTLLQLVKILITNLI